MDSTSEKLTITFSPEQDMQPLRRRSLSPTNDTQEHTNFTFRLEAVGVLGSTEIDYPNERDVLEVYECERLVRNTCVVLQCSAGWG